MIMTNNTKAKKHEIPIAIILFSWNHCVNVSIKLLVNPDDSWGGNVGDGENVGEGGIVVDGGDVGDGVITGGTEADVHSITCI